jgi:hypothetical protein
VAEVGSAANLLSQSIEGNMDRRTALLSNRPADRDTVSSEHCHNKRVLSPETSSPQATRLGMLNAMPCATATQMFCSPQHDSQLERAANARWQLALLPG